MKSIVLWVSILISTQLVAGIFTLEEAIDKALQNYPDIKTFMLRIDQSKQSYKLAHAAYFPQLSVQAGYNPVQTFALPINGRFHTVEENSWSAGVTLRERLWDFSQTQNRVEAARVDEQIARLSLHEAKALLVYRVKALYKTILLQQEAIHVQEEDLKRKEAYYKQARALRRQGLKTKADESRFLAEVYTAKEQLAISRAACEKARTTLSLYTGEHLDSDTKLQNILSQPLPQNPDTLTPETLIVQNQGLKIDALTVEKNRLLHKAARDAHYGSIDATASLTHLNSLNSYDSKFVGIALSVPLYTGGRLSAQSQKAKIAAQVAKAQKASKSLALRDEIASLQVDIDRYKETIAARKAQLAAAQESARVLEARYRAGMGTYIQLLDATAQRLGGRLAILRAYYERSLAYDRIIYLKGATK